MRTVPARIGRHRDPAIPMPRRWREASPQAFDFDRSYAADTFCYTFPMGWVQDFRMIRDGAN